MTTLYICRHGQTFFNREKRMQGQMNSNLTPKGERQAQELAEKSEPWGISAVCSSTLGRAVQTAEFCASKFGVQVEQYEGLCERNFGLWQGQLAKDTPEYEQFRQICYKQLDAIPVEGAENTAEVRERMIFALLQIVQKHQSNVLIVSHGDAMQCLASKWVGAKPISNTGGFKLSYIDNELHWSGWLE